ncbi:KAR-UP oxidoreductase 1 [Striga hermonthica]|uniref:KAR-UP oxidoreductase 1 n=1 Tax=Striga hermonthica TaxID=68872 RepID=A0A9N7RLI6_STRHE|nr:KAR-UP oxidoreductase 1 [Striga hermonthica]
MVESYKVSPQDRARKREELACVPLIDLDRLCDPSRRPVVVEEIANACRLYGFFQVINHGIPEPILNKALSVATDFFNLPTQDKAKLMSNNVYEPVRYCTSIKDGLDPIPYRRNILKHYANPLQDWIKLWPENPSDYRQKMGEYAKAVQELSVKIMEAITESLGLGSSYLSTELNQGMQVIAVNCYPPCPEPELSLGLPPHSDYSCLTILNQDSFGLEILDFEDEAWKGIPVIPGALQVNVGDHLEILSNGKYKSVVHRATLNSGKQRISIASLHSLGMDVKIGVAKELVDEHHPNGYKESSFRDFLDFISRNDLGKGCSYHDTIKIQE